MKGQRRYKPIWAKNKRLKGALEELDPRKDVELSEQDLVNEIKRNGNLPKDDPDGSDNK